MDWREYKTEFAIVACGFVAVMGVLKVLGAFDSGRSGDGPEISYEMPRPKSDAIGDFGLDGREVERRVVNPFGSKKPQTAPAPIAPPKANAPGKAVSQNKTKKAKAKSGEAAAGPAAQTSVNVVDANPESRVSEGLGGAGAQQVVLSRVNRPAAVAVAKAPEEGEKMSPDQWRALLTAEPTAANMVRLLQAVSRQEVDQPTFYSIVDDLSRSQNVQTQKVAVYGLSALPTLRSFAKLVELENQVDPAVRSQVTQALGSFTQSSRIGVLQQALQQNDLTISMKAAQLVLEGIQNAKNPTPNPQDERTLRGEVRNTSLEDYNRLLPVFQRWAASGNPGLTGIANQILQELGAPTTVKISAGYDLHETF